MIPETIVITKGEVKFFAFTNKLKQLKFIKQKDKLNM